MAKPTVGIICEYDPFHKGHMRQFREIRRLLPDAEMICLMSGCFTQRGAPALLMPHDRASAALEGGADLVLQMPAVCSVRDAEHFAIAGVKALEELGFIDYISFGCENDLSDLEKVADFLQSPTERYKRTLHESLASGNCYAHARGDAIRSEFEEQGLEPFWERPNNILAISYLSAMRAVGSHLIPLAVIRSSDHSEKMLLKDQYPSSTAIRRAFLAGNHIEASEFAGYNLPPGPVCRPESLDSVLLYLLRNSSPDKLAKLPDCSEGLENRLYAAAQQACSREELLLQLKTKRYTHARLSRMCCHVLLGISDEQLSNEPSFLRLLGYRRASECTRRLRESRVSILSRARDFSQSDEQQQIEMRAWDIWCLGAGIPAGSIKRQKVRNETN